MSVKTTQKTMSTKKTLKRNPNYKRTMTNKAGSLTTWGEIGIQEREEKKDSNTQEMEQNTLDQTTKVGNIGP